MGSTNNVKLTCHLVGGPLFGRGLFDANTVVKKWKDEGRVEGEY